MAVQSTWIGLASSGGGIRPPTFCVVQVKVMVLARPPAGVSVMVCDWLTVAPLNEALAVMVMVPRPRRGTTRSAVEAPEAESTSSDRGLVAGVMSAPSSVPSVAVKVTAVPSGAGPPPAVTLAVAVTVLWPSPPMLVGEAESTSAGVVEQAAAESRSDAEARSALVRFAMQESRGAMGWTM